MEGKETHCSAENVLNLNDEMWSCSPQGIVVENDNGTQGIVVQNVEHEKSTKSHNFCINNLIKKIMIAACSLRSLRSNNFTVHSPKWWI